MVLLLSIPSNHLTLSPSASNTLLLTSPMVHDGEYSPGQEIGPNLLNFGYVPHQEL